MAQKAPKPDQAAVLKELNDATFAEISSQSDGEGNIVSVSLMAFKIDSQMEAKAFANLSKLSKLQRFSLEGFTRVDDSVFAHLKQCHQLKTLRFRRCMAITGSGCQHLSNLAKLEHVTFDQCQNLDNEAVKHLGKIANLKSLDLTGTAVTDAGIKHLAHHRNLQSLNMGLTKVTNRGLAEVGTISKLSDIVVPGATSNDALQSLLPLKNLKTIATDYERNSKITWGAVVSMFLKQQRTVPEALEALGAAVYVENGQVMTLQVSDRFHILTKKIQPQNRRTLRIGDDLLPHLESLKHLKHLSIDSGQFTFKKLAIFKPATTIQKFLLYNQKLNDEVLNILNHTPQIEELRLGYGLTGSKFDKIAALQNLTKLSLPAGSVTTSGMNHLARATKLKNLSLIGLKVDDSAYEGFANLKDLRELNLADSNLSDNEMQHFANLHQLEIFNVSRTNITDRGLIHLEKCTALTDLETENTKVSASGRLDLFANRQKRTATDIIRLQGGRVQSDQEGNVTSVSMSSRRRDAHMIDDSFIKLLLNFPKLSRISLFLQEELVGSGLGQLAELKSLEQLFFYRCDNLTDSALEQIGKCKSLRQLRITRSDQLTAEGLKHLSGLKKLQRLKISGKGINEAALEDLRRALPNCKISK